MGTSGVEAARERFKADPTARAAKDLHATLMAAGERNEARQLRALLAESFAGDAGVLAHTAGVLEFYGEAVEALVFYERAHRVDPNEPEARAAIGRQRIKEGRLEDAAGLLAFLKEPGGTTGRDPLWELARAYQQSGRHVEALDLFTILLRDLPALAQEKEFRQAVALSERAAGGGRSILPRRAFRLGRGALWSAALVVGAVGALGWNLYTARSRTLHIVGRLEGEVEVEVKGHGKVRLDGADLATLTLPEGRHQAVVTGAVSETIDFTIEAGFFDRFGRDPIYILNVDRSAIIVLERAVYSTSGNIPGSYEIHFGKSFFAFPHVDYGFGEFPKTLQIKGDGVTKTRVEAFPPLAGLTALYRDDTLPRFWDLAEFQLKRRPDDDATAETYVHAARAKGAEERALGFLKAGLDRRPVVVGWHRMYQELAKRSAGEEATIAEYEALLKTDPGNSALIYLHGRLLPSLSASLAAFRRAVEKDPDNAWAHNGIAYDRYSRGEWEEARAPSDKAVDLMPDRDPFVHLNVGIRFACGDLAGLEPQLRGRLQESPLRPADVQALCDVLTAAGRPGDAEQVLKKFEVALRAAGGAGDPALARSLKYHLLYARGEFEALAAVKGDAIEERRARVWGLLELGRLAEAAEVFPLSNATIPDMVHLMVMSAAWRAAGDEEKADQWRRRAASAPDGEEESGSGIRQVLAAKAAPEPEKVLDLEADPSSKAVLLAGLALRFPARAAEYKVLARRLNAGLAYPHHWLTRVTQ